MRRVPFALLVLAAAFLTSASPPPVPGRVAPPAVDFGQPEWVYDGDVACTGSAKRWTPQRICASGADIVLVSDGDHAFLPARYPIRTFDTSACFGLEVSGATPRPENTAAYITRVKAECTAQGKPAPKFLLTPRLDVVQRGALNYDPLSPDSPATLGAFDPAWVLRRDLALTSFEQLLNFFSQDAGSYCTAFGRCYYSPCRGPRTVAYEAPDEWGSPKTDGGCDQASEEGGHLLPELLERLEPGLSTSAVYYLGRITGAAGFATNVKARIDLAAYQDWVAEAVRLRVEAVGADGIVYLHKIEQHRPQGAEAWGTQHRIWLGSVVPEYSAPPFVGAIDTVEELNLTGDTLWSHQPAGGWGYAQYIAGWNALAKKIDAKGIDFAVVTNAKPFDGCSQLDGSWGHASCDDDFDDPTTAGVNEASLIREVIALARWPSIDISAYNRPPPQGFGSSASWAKPKEFASWLASEAPAVERAYFFQATSPRAVAPIGSTDALEPPPPAPSNGKPIANPGNDVLVEAGEDVALSASASTDPGGSVASRLWQIVGGTDPGEPCDAATLTSSSAVSTTLQGASGVGFCHVRLTVTDSGGATDSDTVRVRYVSATLTPSAASGTVPFSPTLVFDVHHGDAPLDFGVFQLGLDTGGAIIASSQTSAGEVCGSGHRCYTYSGFTYATPDADLDPFVEYVVEGQVVLSATTALTANAPSAPVIQQLTVTPPSGTDPFDPLIGVVSAGGTGALTVLADCDNSGGACPTSGTGPFETTLGTGTSVSSAACPAFNTPGANTFRVCVRDSAGTPQVTTATGQVQVVQQALQLQMQLDRVACPDPCDDLDVTILLDGSTCSGAGGGGGVDVAGSCGTCTGSFSATNSSASPLVFANACDCSGLGTKTISATVSGCGTAESQDVQAQVQVTGTPTFTPQLVVTPSSCTFPCPIQTAVLHNGGDATGQVTAYTIDWRADIGGGIDHGPVDGPETCFDEENEETPCPESFDLIADGGAAPVIYTSAGTKLVRVCGTRGGDNSCADAQVVVSEAAPQANLFVEPPSLYGSTTTVGGAVTLSPLTIRNLTLLGDLGYSCSEPVPWLSLSGASGTATNAAPGTVTPSVNTSSLVLPSVNDSTITCVNTANAADSQALPVRVELLDPGGATANGVTTPQGIGFQFDAQYQIGSFLDGQKWVVENTPGGGVQITAMTPNYSAGRNGWAENMRPFAQLTTGQSGCTANAGCQVNTLDDRVSGGGAEPEFIFIAPTTRYGSLPRTIPAGTSVLKVRSSSDSACASGGVGTARCITTASVLTVLASPPPANAMRPPFMGLQKPIFVTTGFNFATMLPSEALLGVSAQYTWPEITASFGDFAVQVPTAFIGEFDGRFLPSTMVSPRLADNISYGCDYGLWLMAGLLRLAQVGTAAEKGPAFYHLLQNAIDHYYATQDPGPRDKDWWGGGCSHHGRKALIMWGGRILAALPANGTGADAMAAFDNGEEAIDNMTYENGASLALWGLTPCSSGTPTCNGTARRCSADRDGGSKKLSNGTESCTVVQETPASQIASGIWSLGPYQLMADVYYGAATVARMYDFEDEWNAARADNSPAFFEYVDRIQGAPWNGACSGHCDQYLGEMYDAYAVP